MCYRTLCLLFVVFPVAMFASVAHGASPAQSGSVTVHVGERASLRYAPDAAAARVGGVNEGDEIAITGCTSTGDWCKLDTGPWIEASALTDLPADHPTVQVPSAPDDKQPTADAAADLRSGPGSSFAQHGNVDAGAMLAITGRTTAGDWYQLEDGSWIAAYLVNDAPTSLQVIGNYAPAPVRSVQIIPPDASGSGFRNKCAGLEESLDNRPVQRMTFAGSKDSKPLIDDGDAALSTDNTRARAAHQYARKIDNFFRQLSAEGYGAWSGCYGGKAVQTYVMKSVVQPKVYLEIYDGFLKIELQSPTTSFQSDWMLYQADESITPQAAYHEWTHGLTENSIGLNSEGPSNCGENCPPGQSGALFESLGDIFAALVSGKYDMCQTTCGRSVADPQKFEDPVTMEDYALKGCTDKNYWCKYSNSGIPSKAAYLMIVGTVSDGDHKLFGNIMPLGPEKVARIYFHALQPKFISNTSPTFNEFAKGVVAACEDIAGRTDTPVQATRTVIDAADCKQVAIAFAAVGMLVPADIQYLLPIAASEPTDTVEEVLIPAGKFYLGCGADEENCAMGDQPMRETTLDNYSIDRYEVTNARYAKCVEAGACTAPSEASYERESYYGNPEFADYPVVNVDAEAAATFCQWAGKRLPTEAEWEKAARGVDGRIYPWGNAEPDATRLNYNQNEGDTTVVGSYPAGASPYGVMDMAGNVGEWTADPFDPAIPGLPVVKGGTWEDDAGAVRAAFRGFERPGPWGVLYGFRCMRPGDKANSDENVDTVLGPLPSPGPDEVLIPAGPFQMGSTQEDVDTRVATFCPQSGDQKEECRKLFEAELPMHTVTLGDYLIDKYEVTNARYAECVKAGVCDPGRSTSTDGAKVLDPNYPVTEVNWGQAWTFCAWDGKRLPTEAEWEKAARGIDARAFPWGNEPKMTLDEMWQAGGWTSLQAVGNHTENVSPYGVMDMVGNLDGEWTNDRYGVYSEVPATNPMGPGYSKTTIDTGTGLRTGRAYVLRPASPMTDFGPIEPRTTTRIARGLYDTSTSVGFRCARSAVREAVDGVDHSLESGVVGTWTYSLGDSRSETGGRMDELFLNFGDDGTVRGFLPEGKLGDSLYATVPISGTYEVSGNEVTFASGIPQGRRAPSAHLNDGGLSIPLISSQEEIVLHKVPEIADLTTKLVGNWALNNIRFPDGSIDPPVPTAPRFYFDDSGKNMVASFHFADSAEPTMESYELRSNVLHVPIQYPNGNDQYMVDLWIREYDLEHQSIYGSLIVDSAFSGDVVLSRLSGDPDIAEKVIGSWNFRSDSPPWEFAKSGELLVGGAPDHQVTWSVFGECCLIMSAPNGDRWVSPVVFSDSDHMEITPIGFLPGEVMREK